MILFRPELIVIDIFSLPSSRPLGVTSLHSEATAERLWGVLGVLWLPPPVVSIPADLPTPDATSDTFITPTIPWGRSGDPLAIIVTVDNGGSDTPSESRSLAHMVMATAYNTFAGTASLI